MTSTSEIVKLNIGGTTFQTTKATLTRFDGFFQTILETDVPVTKDGSGAIFIDRDPTHFRFILNYMRDWDVKLPDSEHEIEEISNEAQYYLLTGLVELCSKQSQVRPIDAIFKTLNSDEEQYSAVSNSNKPVLLISTNCNVNGFVNMSGYSKWKQFIEKHSHEWNIFFNKNDDISWCINPSVTEPKSLDAVENEELWRSGQISNCQRCAHHGKVSSHKAQKQICPYRECHCPKCQVVQKRQKLITDQIRIRKLKRPFYTCSVENNLYTCGHRRPNESLESFLTHLEYHMNLYLADSVEKKKMCKSLLSNF